MEVRVKIELVDILLEGSTDVQTGFTIESTPYSKAFRSALGEFNSTFLWGDTLHGKTVDIFNKNNSADGVRIKTDKQSNLDFIFENEKAQTLFLLKWS